MEIKITTNEILGRRISGTITFDDTVNASLNVTTTGDKTISRLEVVFKTAEKSYGILVYEGNRIRIENADTSEDLQYISNNAQKIIDEVNNIL